MKIKLIVFSLSVIVALLSGCGHNVSTNTYEAAEVGVVSKVLNGTVIAQRPVKIDASNHNIGALAGAAAGGVGGSAIGGSDIRGNIAGAIGGAVVGGVVGHGINKAVNQKSGMEYIIQLKDKSKISVTQAQDLRLSIGQPVLIIYGARTRIVPDETICNG